MRRSYRCDCGGEQWSKRPGRLTRAKLGSDQAEQILSDIELAAGDRPDSCPWYALRHPLVVATIRAHRWWKQGELGTREQIPEALIRAIEVYDTALNSIQAHDIREDRERARVERELQNAQRPARPSVVGRSRR